MNVSRLSMFFAVGLGLPFLGSAVTPVHAVSTGVIHFVGRIVEDGCDVALEKNHVKTRCERNGKEESLSRPISQIGTRPFELPISVGTSQLRWINENHTLGVVTINYH